MILQIDMSKCMVSTIEWFHEMPNGTSKKIKTARTGDPHTHTIGKVMPYSFTFVLFFAILS